MWLPEESVEMPSTGTSVELTTDITRRPGTQASEKYDGGDVLGLCLPAHGHFKARLPPPFP